MGDFAGGASPASGPLQVLTASLPAPPPALPSLAALIATALRVDHPPNGKFDVVVVQPSLSDVLPRGSKLMASQPVYTVYLNVGDRKEWLLHYCAPDTQTRQDGSVVTLGDPRPISAPYPRLTFLPANMPVSAEKFVYVHGSIDASGNFRNLSVIGNEATMPESFLTILGNWLFRPATRGSDNALVEVILAIPARRS